MAQGGPSEHQVERFRADLQKLAGAPMGRLGLAVSGGPDSLALLLLAHAAGPEKVEAATVDHQLRPESAAEAASVADLCDRLGIAHAVLKPAGPIAGSLQAAARQARYALIEQWRRERGLDWLVTAHHADDQAETLLMRLNRGAGVAGLSGVRAINRHVIRPLLGWRRTELAAIVRAAGIIPVADPGNDDRRFDRVRIRQAIAEADWIDPQGLARSAAAAAEAEAALDWAAKRLLAERKCGDGGLDPSGVPAELRRRLVLEALRRIDPAAEPRGHELTRLLATLESGGTATLAGVKCVGGATWRFEPAPPRRSG